MMQETRTHATVRNNLIKDIFNKWNEPVEKSTCQEYTHVVLRTFMFKCMEYNNDSLVGGELELGTCI